MAKIKLTKNELKVQKDALKMYNRYLPTLTTGIPAFTALAFKQPKIIRREPSLFLFLITSHT